MNVIRTCRKREQVVNNLFLLLFLHDHSSLYTSIHLFVIQLFHIYIKHVIIAFCYLHNYFFLVFSFYIIHPFGIIYALKRSPRRRGPLRKSQRPRRVVIVLAAAAFAIQFFGYYSKITTMNYLLIFERGFYLWNFEFLRLNASYSTTVITTTSTTTIDTGQVMDLFWSKKKEKTTPIDNIISTYDSNMRWFSDKSMRKFTYAFFAAKLSYTFVKIL